MTTILLYVTRDREVFVLESSDSDLIEAYGREFERWPYDLGAYALKSGLYSWKGTVPELEDIDWNGSFRTLLQDIDF